MTPRDRVPDRNEAGFVLIGVVIFVLALTIIGISLFSLSSYEAQFLQRSIDREQAFQTAVGGIDRARFVLTLPGALLVDVTQDLPPFVRTVAIQRKGALEDSTGPVDWGTVADSVHIRVTAGRAGAQRMVEASFRPVRTQDYYSQLIAVRDGIEVLDEAPLIPRDRDHTVLLDGPIWESSPQDTSDWLDRLRQPEPVGIRKSPEVPLPEVGPYLTAGRIAAALPAVRFDPPDQPPPAPTVTTYTLDAGGTPGIPAYFRAEVPAPDFTVNTFPHSSCIIQVRGLAVWLLPHGAMFYQGTEIRGDPATDCLVLIAEPKSGGFSNLGPTASICFLGCLRSDIPVIFVSNGKVLIWHENDYDEDTFTADLAIFARSVEFMGPDAHPHPPALPTVLQLYRDPNGRLNTFFLDALANQGALPNASSASGRRLDLVPGSWQASDR